MTDEALKYDLEGMAVAHEDILAASRNLAKTHADVIVLMNQLQQSWTQGTAAAAWRAYQDEWNTIFADLASELAGLAAAVDLCRQNAYTAEDANVQMWSG